jgi:hypothetical protein
VRIELLDSALRVSCLQESLENGQLANIYTKSLSPRRENLPKMSVGGMWLSPIPNDGLDGAEVV